MPLRRGVPAQPIYNGYCHATEKYGLLPRISVNNGNKVSATLSLLFVALLMAF